jgi:hypothetical protein
MKRDFIRIFLKNLVWIALFNASISVSALFLQSGSIKKIFQWVVGILNFPTIWFIVKYATAFLKNPNVNWYIATALLSFIGSILWAFAITLAKMGFIKLQSTEPDISTEAKSHGTCAKAP